MNEIMIGTEQITVKEYRGQRVVTFKDIDKVHQRPEGTARKRFNDNKGHFVEGEDYYRISPSEFRTAIGDMDPRQQNDVVLITESGYLMLVKSFADDLAWKVQRQLVKSYFKIQQIAFEELSPNMQEIIRLANEMARKELEDKRRDRQIAELGEQVQKAVNTTERIKDEFVQPFDNWRDDINKKVRQISQASGISYQDLFTQLYDELEKSGYNLSRRQQNKRRRMEESGCTKTEISKETTKIAIIETDKKAKKIFSDIVARYAVKYVA